MSCWRFSEKRSRLRRGSSGVDVVTAQGSFWQTAIFGHASGGAHFKCCTKTAICATYVSWRSRNRNPRPLNELCSALPSLPARLQQVGRFVAANDYDATTRSMRDLAAEAGADPASFTRLAKALGYSGWDELRAALTEARRPAQPRHSRPAPAAAARVPTPTSSLVADKLEAEAAGLARISAGSVAGAAKALHAARRIWIAGFRSCRSVAELLNYQLRLFRPDEVQLVGGSGPEDLDLGAFHSGDAVVVIGFAPYSTASVLSARAAHRFRRHAGRDCRHDHRADGGGRRSSAALRSGGFARILPEPDRRHRDRAVAGRGHLRAGRRRAQSGASRRPKAGWPRCRNMLPRKVDRHGLSAKSRVLHRSLRETPPKAVGGEGVWLIAEDGRRILDASGGAAVSCLGHQHPRVLEAMSRQASKLAYAHTGFFSSEPAEALADKLVGDEPGGLAYAYFVSGGSEAIEASIKLARQYFIETRPAAAPALHRTPPELSRQYAGRARRRRQRLAPRALCAAVVVGLQPCDAGLRLSRKARQRIRGGFRRAAGGRAGGGIPASRPGYGGGVHRRAGGGRHRRMRAGAGGIFPRRPRDLRPARRAPDPRRGDVRHGPHRHAARVGAGRHRARHPGRSPRGWAAAISRSAPCSRAARIVDTIREGSGAFQHGHTYLAHPLACAAALEVQQVIDDEQSARQGEGARRVSSSGG